MKKLAYGVMDWQKKGTERHPYPIDDGEQSYDYMTAIETVTKKMKPRTRMLSNFTADLARDDSILKTTDMFENVKLENTKEEREAMIEARKTARNKALNIVNF